LRSRAPGSPGQPPPDPAVLAADRRALQNSLVLLQRALEAGDVKQAVELYRTAQDQARTSTSTAQRRWLAALEEDGRLARWHAEARTAPTPVAEVPAHPVRRPPPSPAPEPLRQPSSAPAAAVAESDPAPGRPTPLPNPGQIAAAAVQTRTVLGTVATSGTTVTWSALLRRAPALAQLPSPERDRALRQACEPDRPGEPLLAAVLTGPLRDMHPSFPTLLEQVTGRIAPADRTTWAYEVLLVQQYWRHRRP